MTISNEVTSVAPPTPGATPVERAGRRGRAFPRYADSATRNNDRVQRRHEARLGSIARIMPMAPTVLAEVALREKIFRRMLAGADAIAAAASLVLALTAIGGYTLRPEFLFVAPLIVLVAKIQGLYDHDELVIHKSTLDELPRLVNLATLFALLAWLTHHYIVIGAPRSAYLLVLWLLLIVTLAVARFAARCVARHHAPVERCLMVGSQAMRHRLASVPDSGRLLMVGNVPLSDVVHDHAALQRIARELRVHRIIVGLSDHDDSNAAMDVVRAVMSSGLRVSLLPSALSVVGSSVVYDDLGGIPLLGVSRFGLSRSSWAVKRGFDIVGSSLLLALCSPLLAVLAIAVKLDSPGPVLFRQTRVGRDDLRFRMLKFRSMVDGADALKDGFRDQNEASGLFKIANDPRVTRVGRLLRRSSLDELPQLINVLRGDMSLVGPRPLVPDEDVRVTGFDRHRLHLTPGMTGRWQILGSARIPLSEMVKIDYLYVANWSLWADIKILLQTVAFVVARRGL
jgi:exopolysaccharide biosynthesis polyprenyl glycosylphosphotransferase